MAAESTAAECSREPVVVPDLGGPLWTIAYLITQIDQDILDLSPERQAWERKVRVLVARAFHLGRAAKVDAEVAAALEDIRFRFAPAPEEQEGSHGG